MVRHYIIHHYLARAWRFNTTLRQLSLMNNSLGPGGAAALQEALRKHNASLVALDVSFNHLASSEVPPPAFCLTDDVNKTCAPSTKVYTEIYRVKPEKSVHGTYIL